MTKFTPSKNQKDIFNFIKKDTKNAVISAVAGSGKTTTLVQALELMPKNKTVIFMAFNKSIVNELVNRIPKRDNILIKTVHSLGYSMLTLNLDGVPEINNIKYRKMLRDILYSYNKKTTEPIKQYGFKNPKFAMKIIDIVESIEDLNEDVFVSDVLALCNLGRLHLVDLENKSSGVLEIRKLASIHSVSNFNGEDEVAWYLIKLGIGYMNVVDYTDMICLPLIYDLPTPTYDFVFIDECQDLNTCQRLIMMKSIKPNTGRFIAVGDPKQAIYAFAGADSESFHKLITIPNTIELPLSTTYRCSKQIVDMVKHINPLIKHQPKNTKGEIVNNVSYKEIKDGDMVLCRNTFPIVALCVKLLGEGKRAYVIGSDIGLSLKTMIVGCQRKTEEYNMINVLSRLYHEKDKMVKKNMETLLMSENEAKVDPKVILYNEKIMVIETLTKNETDPDVVIEKIIKLFSDSQKVGICLSNIHKSKGLESDRVFIVHRELMPSKYAQLDWELEQERNLKYVAYTRAKTKLLFVNDFDAFEQHDSKRDVVTIPNDSEHVGGVSDKLKLKLKILNRKEFTGPFGESVVYEMVDDNGNLFSKFGEINEDYLINGDKVDENADVEFYGVIKEHTEFRGNKITRLGRIMKKLKK
jgi:DNA helicase-2/ATP-dependent DNA helicase PcrA